MSSLHDYLVLTKKLAQFLQDLPKEEEREQYITEVNAIIEEREAILKALRPITDEDKLLFRNEIVELTQVIDKQLASLMAEIKIDIKQLQIQKKSTVKYDYHEPYNVDGSFIDSKK